MSICLLKFVGIDSSECRYWRSVFAYLSYLGSKTYRHNYLSMRNTIRTLVAEEMYFGF